MKSECGYKHDKGRTGDSNLVQGQHLDEKINLKVHLVVLIMSKEGTGGCEFGIVMHFQKVK